MSEKLELINFQATFHRILSTIISVQPEMAENIDWLNKLINYNVPNGKRSRGLTVVETFKLLNQHNEIPATEEDFERARIVGWTMEFFQAYFFLIDDIIDQSSTRRGKPCWYKLV